jgi:ribonuclease HI
MWRLVENGLAVGSELSHRKIKDGIVCLECVRTESLIHRFWSCPHSAEAWEFLREKTGLKFEAPPKRLACHAELKGWLLDWIGKKHKCQAELFFTLIYNLWLARNDARESGQIQNPIAVVEKTVAAVEEWRNRDSRSHAITTIVAEQWSPPEAGWCKINTDGAFRQAEGNGGGGVVVRDHHGSFRAGACRFFTHVADAEVAELLGCREGLLLARELHVTKVVLETDCIVMASNLRQRDKDRSLHGPLVEEVKELLVGFDEITVRTVRRRANEVAHVLAKEGCDNKLSRSWLGVPPAVIVSVLDSYVPVN